MKSRIIDKICSIIRIGSYDLTFYAIEEMAEDELGILDIEHAILTGKIIKTEKDDPRGVKYIIEGIGINQSTIIGIVGRFKETGIFLIITVYKIN